MATEPERYVYGDWVVIRAATPELEVVGFVLAQISTGVIVRSHGEERFAENGTFSRTTRPTSDTIPDLELCDEVPTDPSGATIPEED